MKGFPILTELCDGCKRWDLLGGHKTNYKTSGLMFSSNSNGNFVLDIISNEKICKIFAGMFRCFTAAK